MNTLRIRWGRGELLAGLMVGTLMATTMVAIFLAAPIERTMGEIQKIVYVHVAVAWCGLIAFVITAISGAACTWFREKCHGTIWRRPPLKLDGSSTA